MMQRALHSSGLFARAWRVRFGHPAVVRWERRAGVRVVEAAARMNGAMGELFTSIVQQLGACQPAHVTSVHYRRVPHPLQQQCLKTHDVYFAGWSDVFESIFTS